MLQVRKYGELYAQTRLETLDCLDKLSDLDTHDDLKSKLLFSVIVVSTFLFFLVYLYKIDSIFSAFLPLCSEHSGD